MRDYKPSFYFVFSLLALAIFYNYQEISFKKPQSIHKWRQADGASLALNYYQHGMHFFHPQTHNLTSDGGQSGAACPSEVPILYFGVALLYKLFGYHDFIFRILNTLLFFLGLCYLFKIFQYLLKDTLWSLLLSVLFFTAPVLVYYGNNFLSNTGALSFAIIGWYFFIKYYFERKYKLLYTACTLFFIAACFKLTSLISLLSILAVVLLNQSNQIRLDRTEKLIKSFRPFLLYNVFLLTLLAIWIFYARSYNTTHDSSYFSTTTFPIWSLSPVEIKGVLENIQTLWLDQYFHPSVILLLSACLVFLIWNRKKNISLINLLLAFIGIQIIAFILLQFWTFADHDYYVIDLYIFPMLILLFTAYAINNQFPQVFQSKYLKIGFTVFILFNVVYARQEINTRYSEPINDFESNAAIYSITPYLRQIGIHAEDRVISIPDFSHASLYLMNQKGWTEYTDARFNIGSKIPYNQDSAGIQLSISRGAKYLIINGISEIHKKPYLKSFCKNLKGRYQNVFIFDLLATENNFNPDAREVLKKYNCDAEHLTQDGNFFQSTVDSVLFEFGQTQTKEQAHSGMNACKLDELNPYGMTLKIPQIKSGFIFEITVWRKASENSKSTLIASSEPNPFYSGNYKIIEREPSGWVKLKMEFEISPSLAGQELKIYTYNPDKQVVYFDDLEVICYKMIE